MAYTGCLLCMYRPRCVSKDNCDQRGELLLLPSWSRFPSIIPVEQNEWNRESKASDERDAKETRRYEASQATAQRGWLMGKKRGRISRLSDGMHEALGSSGMIQSKPWMRLNSILPAMGATDQMLMLYCMPGPRASPIASTPGCKHLQKDDGAVSRLAEQRTCQYRRRRRDMGKRARSEDQTARPVARQTPSTATRERSGVQTWPRLREMEGMVLGNGRRRAGQAPVCLTLF